MRFERGTPSGEENDNLAHDPESRLTPSVEPKVDDERWGIPRRARWVRLWSKDPRVMFLIVFAPIAMTFAVVGGAGWDPSPFGAFGEEAVEDTAFVEDLLGREVVVRASLGHDGKFFFIQAIDPWIQDPALYETLVDPPRYRAQRMLFPVLAGAFGLASPAGALWGMAAVNTLALIIGSLAMVSLLDRRDLSQWWSLSFLLGPGMISEWALGGGGVVALALLIVAIDQLERRSRGLSTAAFVGCVLAREIMIVAIVGIVAHHLIRRREFLWRLALLAPAALGVWRLYVNLRLEGVEERVVSVMGSGLFVGLRDGVAQWFSNPADLAVGVGLSMACGLVLWRILAGSDELLTWSAAPFVALLPILAANVLAHYFDFARAVAPVVPAAATELALAISVRMRPTPSSYGSMNPGSLE